MKEIHDKNYFPIQVCTKVPNNMEVQILPVMIFIARTN